MATYNLVQAGSRLPGHKKGASFEIGKIVRAANVNSGAGIGAGDVLQVIAVPAMTLVLGVFVQVRAGQDPDELCAAALSAMTVGDAADPNGFGTAINCAAAVNTYGGVGDGGAALGYSSGKLYTAADTIDLTCNGASAVGIIKVIALVVPFDDRAFSDNMVAQ